MAESQKDALVRMIKKRSSGRKPSPAAAATQQVSADAQDYYARHEVVVEAAGTHSPCLKLEAAPFPAPLLKLLQAQFETPTPIQAACWPLAATACRDVLAIARCCPAPPDPTSPRHCRDATHICAHVLRFTA